MLETIARSFEVDIATSKVTCIDLMRANPFDVLVASERLSDGSGLELLSHVAQRWPDTLRVLVIEPSRLKLLRGKLGPFRLHATMRYPVEEDELETVLNRLGSLLAEAAAAQPDEPEPEPEPEPELPAPPPVARPVSVPAAPGARSGFTPAGNARASVAPVPPARPASPPVARPAPLAANVPVAKPAIPARASAAPAGRSTPPPPPQNFQQRPQPARSTSAPASAKKPGVPIPSRPLAEEPKLVKRRLGNYTPLGAPEDDAQLRIVEREFDQTMAPLAARAIRNREEANRTKTPQEKAKSLAGNLGKSLRKLIKKDNDEG